MKRLFLFLYLILLSASFLFAQDNGKDKAARQTERKYESIWEGKLKIQSTSLRLVLKIYKKADGSIGGFVDSPDQGAKDIPVGSVSVTEDSLKFAIPALRASYNGRIDKTGMNVSGNFKQAALDVPLELQKVDKVTEVKRPQTPIKPFPYNSEDITFENKEANITLAGTFTYPKEGSSFPVVVMVTGSGPQDRDETLFNHKPFLVIADFFARNGIAVLRYDDRGIGKSKGNFAKATSEDFASDALAAVEYLKSRTEINKKKIGIMGHSEGGLIAPMCAAKSKDVSFIVILAGPGVPGKDILLRQGYLIAKASGEKEDEIKKGLSFSKQLYDIVLASKDSTQAAEELELAIDEHISSLSPEERNKPDYKKENLQQAIKQISTPWFKFFMKYDPRKDLVKLKIPVLALNGGNDLQVDPKQNLPQIEKALKKAGNRKYKIVEIPGLNHLFQTIKKGTIDEYGEIEETLSPKVLEIAKDWILKI